MATSSWDPFLKLGFQTGDYQAPPDRKIHLSRYAGMGHYSVIVENLSQTGDRRFRLDLVGGSDGHGADYNWKEFEKLSDPKTGKWYTLEETQKYACRRPI